MTNKTLLTFLACGLSCSALAETSRALHPREANVDRLNAIKEVASMRAATSALTVEDVGDVDSFGRAKIYLGVEQTRGVTIQADCTGWDPASGPCIETAPAPGVTLVDEFDLGSISLPANATNSILCFTFTQFATWGWFNPTASTATARMALWATVQIENDALLGLNNANGVPFNGKLFVDPIPIIVSTHEHTLPAGAYEVQRERSTRSCTGGIVNTRTLAAEGLTDMQIKDFFKEPMTVTFGTEGSVSLVDFAVFSVGARLYGDD
ncbi:MAG: hypothetical protein HKN58_06270 [Xanthomonadales bacterium]|nr:hypothetical protein [Xanthomonadales bacterium]